jgi:rubrerythrin
MISLGERNRKEKIKLIHDLKKSTKKYDRILAKRIKILFVCNQCGLRIFYEIKDKKKGSAYMGYHFEDYLVFFQNQPNFKPFENNYKKTKTQWLNWCNYICLCCGTFIEDKEKAVKNVVKKILY